MKEGVRIGCKEGWSVHRSRLWSITYDDASPSIGPRWYFDPQHNCQLVLIMLVIGPAVVQSCIYSGSFMLYLAFMMVVLFWMDTVRMD